MKEVLGRPLAHPVPCLRPPVKDTGCQEEACQGLSWGGAGGAESHGPSKLLPKCTVEAAASSQA